MLELRHLEIEKPKPSIEPKTAVSIHFDTAKKLRFQCQFL